MLDKKVNPISFIEDITILKKRARNIESDNDYSYCSSSNEGEFHKRQKFDVIK